MAQDLNNGLRRTLSLWQVVLYGMGVTIGAGIYVLVGVAASRSGVFAPLAFLVAAALLSFTALSFAELGTRLPVSAREAAYVNAGFQRKGLTLATGLFVVTTTAVSAATVSVGAAGYLSVFWPAPQPILILIVVLGMGVIASLTTAQSVTLAGIMTTIEIGGLLVILALALAFPLEKLAHMTAQGTLVIFFLVNGALARIRHKEQILPPHVFHAPAWAPYAGMVATFILLIASMWRTN